MSKTLFFSIIILFIAGYSADSANIKLQMDDAIFFDKSGKFRWEFYYSFNQTELKFISRDGQVFGEMFFHVKISSNIKVEDEKKWIVTHLKDVNAGIDDMTSLLGQKDFLLNPGQYVVDIYVQDFYDTSSYSEYKFDLIVGGKKDGSLSISSLQLAQVIEDTANSEVLWNNAFIKFNYYVVPMPSLTFITSNQKLHSYLEIYRNSEQDEDVVLEYLIKDAHDNIIYSKNKELATAQLSDTESFDLIDYQSGIYNIYAKAHLKSDTSGSIIKSKRFFIVNPEKNIKPSSRYLESQIFEKSEFSSLTVEQTEIEIQKISPIMTGEEMAQFKLLSTAEAKQRMLFKFWQSRDLDTTNDFNEALFNFKERVKFSQTYFTYGLTPGWKTDRGRIVIKYGFPGNRLQYPIKNTQRPYEEWFYEEIQGGVSFYFVDIFGNGNFELVHSTAYGEMRYDNWYNEYVLKNRRQLDERDNDVFKNKGW